MEEIFELNHETSRFYLGGGLLVMLSEPPSTLAALILNF